MNKVSPPPYAGPPPGSPEQVTAIIAELRRLNGLPEGASDAVASINDPWEMIVDTLRIRDELGFRPIYPSYYAARDAGVL